jgi:hypothetical protein
LPKIGEEITTGFNKLVQAVPNAFKQVFNIKNKIDMSFGWFTLGSSGDVQITSLNVGKGILFTERNTGRVGINVGDPPPSLLAHCRWENPLGIPSRCG